MVPNRVAGPQRWSKSKSTAQPRGVKRKRELEDIESLRQQVSQLDPVSNDSVDEFSQLPLSQSTQDGLKASHYTKLTAIQARGIPISLKGSDILGAAKTGSGKTLSFIVPVLENLYRKRWTEYDGVGALILSPTRELAIQIFNVLRKVGRNHTFSAGLVIGGKSLQEERERLSRMNILVATPGRILQHMDQTADLDIGNLQMLVLDEADRILDMGFKDTVDAIVEHLPRDRQTILFSATQTKRVSDLARLSLSEPEFISVHETADSATPSKLQQNYVTTPLPDKLDTLWSFIRANVKKKILVFLSSGKQVRFVYEAMRHLQPGLPLLHLHGRQKQAARLDITTKFSNSKYACLFSTDVAARGLDFPAVDWVVQVDCPEDADTYIHRVGRTARYEREGRAVLFLDPSEVDGMLTALERKRVTHIEEIHVRQKKMQNTIKDQLQNMCFKDPELKYLGQKAFVSYVRSVYIQQDKDIFNVKKLDLEGYASSMGLPGAPRVKFVKGEDAKSRKNMPRALAALTAASDSDEESGNENQPQKTRDKAAVRTKYDRMFERRNQDVLAEHYSKLIHDDESMEAQDDHETADADEDDDFLAIKRRFEAGDEALGAARTSDPEDDSEQGSDDEQKQTNSSKTSLAKTIKLSNNPDAEPLIIDSNRRSKLLKSKKALLKYKGHGSHLVFSDDDDNDEGKEKVYYEKEEQFTKKGAPAEQRERFLQDEQQRIKLADEIDREIAREKRRDKKIKRKERERLAEMDDADEDDNEAEVQLGGNGVHIPVDLGPMPEDGFVDGEESSPEPPKQKRQKKWFEDPSSSDGDNVGDASLSRRKQLSSINPDRKRAKFDEGREEPQTLEDLEALATGLLGTT